MTDQTFRQHSHSEVRDGMRIDWNVPITATNGLSRRADVFRPLNWEVVAPERWVLHGYACVRVDSCGRLNMRHKEQETFHAPPRSAL
jgi:hypothetical protein